MKRIVFHQFGKPADILNAESTETTAPGPDDVLIKVLASPINPSDIMFVQNLYGIRPQLPSGAGFEGVGIVEAVGSNAKVTVGTRVSFTAIGAWSEYVITNHRTLIPVPDAMNDETAAQLFVNPFYSRSDGGRLRRERRRMADDYGLYFGIRKNGHSNLQNARH